MVYALAYISIQMCTFSLWLWPWKALKNHWNHFHSVATFLIIDCNGSSSLRHLAPLQDIAEHKANGGPVVDFKFQINCRIKLTPDNSFLKTSATGFFLSLNHLCRCQVLHQLNIFVFNPFLFLNSDRQIWRLSFIFSQYIFICIALLANVLRIVKTIA